MPIDVATITRDARACIADWPVTIRHYYESAGATAFVEMQVGLNATDDASMLLAGGLLDEMTVTILAIAADFVVWPRPRDRVDLLLKQNTWVQMEIKRVPDFYDPILPTIQCVLGTPSA